MDMKQVGQAINKYWGNVSGKNVREFNQMQEEAIAAARLRKQEGLQSETASLNDEIKRFNENVNGYRSHLTEQMRKDYPDMSAQDIEAKVFQETSLDAMATPEQKQRLQRLANLSQESWNIENSNPLPQHTQNMYKKELKNLKKEQFKSRFDTALALGTVGGAGSIAKNVVEMNRADDMNKEASLTLRSIYKKEN